MGPGPSTQESPVSHTRPQVFSHLRVVSVCSGKVPEGHRIKLVLPSWVLGSGHPGLGPVGLGLLWAPLQLPGRIPAAHTRLGLCRRQGDSGLASSPGTPGQRALALLVSVASLLPRLATGPLHLTLCPRHSWPLLSHIKAPESRSVGRRDEVRTGQGRLDFFCRAGLLMSPQPHTVDH